MSAGGELNYLRSVPTMQTNSGVGKAATTPPTIRCNSAILRRSRADRPSRRYARRETGRQAGPRAARSSRRGSFAQGFFSSGRAHAVQRSPPAIRVRAKIDISTSGSVVSALRAKLPQQTQIWTLSGLASGVSKTRRRYGAGLQFTLDDRRSPNRARRGGISGS